MRDALILTVVGAVSGLGLGWYVADVLLARRHQRRVDRALELLLRPCTCRRHTWQPDCPTHGKESNG